MAVSSDCIFCNATSESLVYRGDDGIIVLDDPIRAGHVLVGASSHAESLHDVTPDEAAAMFALAARTARSIVATLGATKTYVAAIGDKDSHFHVHLLPKMDGDPNLGPHVFGDGGWASFLPAVADSDVVARVSDAIRAELA